MLRRSAALLVAWSFACAHGPAPAGSRPVGGAAQIVRGDASAEVTLSYDTGPGRVVSITAEVAGGGTGSVGPVSVEVRSKDLSIDGDAPVWTTSVAAGGRTSHTWVLRPRRDGVADLEVLHGLAERGKGEVTPISFRVEGDALSLCAAAGCRDK